MKTFVVMQHETVSLPIFHDSQQGQIFNTINSINNSVNAIIFNKSIPTLLHTIGICIL